MYEEYSVSKGDDPLSVDVILTSPAGLCISKAREYIPSQRMPVVGDRANCSETSIFSVKKLTPLEYNSPDLASAS